MLNITYAPNDAALAERMQKELSKTTETFDANILIILVSPTSVTDKSVLKALDTAIAQKHSLLPVIVEKTTLPQSIRHVEAVDLTKGYDFNAVMIALRQRKNGQDIRRRNTRIAWGLFSIVLLSFVISVYGLSTGYIGVPVDEFSTEAAEQQRMIETFTFPTLDPLMPRTTQDAQNFPRTVEAANTRNAPLLMLTASALPANLQATQEAFLTIEAATLTARADMTSIAATETPEE
ncbi:MAG: hypothetical protein Q9P01_02685 [Anaerolineae bacterium]|nr:hypothetical protein [Anaerolineae bacterium]MDQ7033763.1 hypothetical protein [Anaerolineae bacterium]